MNKLKALIAKRKEKLAGRTYIIRGEEEEKKRQDYLLVAKKIEEEDEIKLGKRLEKLEEFYDFAKLNIKKIVPRLKIKPQTDEQKNIEENIQVNDVQKRNVADIDKEFTEEDYKLLLDHNIAFQKKRAENPDTDRLNPPDYGEEVEYDEKCDDVYFWLSSMSKDWETTVTNNSEVVNNTRGGRQKMTVFRETKRSMWNLIELLVNRTCNAMILNKLYHIVHYCLLREYVLAHDKYMDLTIGNAPWPIGVTMVGIHERSGRAKIFSSEIPRNFENNF